MLPVGRRRRVLSTIFFHVILSIQFQSKWQNANQRKFEKKN